MPSCDNPPAKSSGLRFRRELLPPASSFYKREFTRLSRPSRGWARTACPLHGGDNPTAFSVNLESGGFYCHSCGAGGGDLVAFVMERDKVDFKTACMALGAWDASDITPAQSAEYERQRRDRERQRANKDDSQRRVTMARRELGDQMHLYERILALAGQRLDQTHDGDEAEILWKLMSDTLEVIRIAESDFAALAELEDRLGIWHDPDLLPIVRLEKLLMTPAEVKTSA